MPVFQLKNFDFNNSNKTNSSTDAEIEEEENTNTYFKPIIITKGNNKEKKIPIHIRKKEKTTTPLFHQGQEAALFRLKKKLQL